MFDGVLSQHDGKAAAILADLAALGKGWVWRTSRFLQMQRLYKRWFSPHLHRDMELLVFGHAGARVLVFPTSRRRFYEWEDFGMIVSLQEHLERGWIQLFCVDGIDAETWYAFHRSPVDRARRQEQYNRYLRHEVLPFSEQSNGNPFLIVVGASFGAYHAINFSLRHPDKVGRVLGLSGLYDIRRFADGSQDEAIYFNNPVEFLANEHDTDRLAALRNLEIILAVGQTDPLCLSSQQLSDILWSKGVWHALRIWDGWCHDWPFWAKMLQLYLAGPD